MEICKLKDEYIDELKARYVKSFIARLAEKFPKETQELIHENEEAQELIHDIVGETFVYGFKIGWGCRDQVDIKALLKKANNRDKKEDTWNLLMISIRKMLRWLLRL